MQELGGSLGIAVIGSIVASSFRHSLDAGGLPGRLSAAPARSSIAAADATAAHAGPLAARVLDLAHQSFTSAMTTGFTVAGLLAVGGALIVSRYRAVPNALTPPSLEARPLAPLRRTDPNSLAWPSSNCSSPHRAPAGRSCGCPCFARGTHRVQASSGSRAQGAGLPAGFLPSSRIRAAPRMTHRNGSSTTITAMSAAFSIR